MVGDIETAYVVNLVNGDEFWAERGKGAFLNGEAMHTQKDDIFYLVAYEAQAPHRDIPRIIPLLSESRKTRCLGATRKWKGSRLYFFFQILSFRSPATHPVRS
jgi:fructose-1,6-bisphosphatase/inositol monophosphatase family enzyme